MNFVNQQFLYVLILFGVIVIIPYLVLCYAPLKILAPWKSVIAKDKSILRPVLLSLSTLAIIYGVLLLGSLVQFKQDLPTWYLVLSLPMVVLVHDAYFYWTHYLMHKSKFLYRFHKHHHLSGDTTPLDVLAFHPVEAVVHFIFFVIYPLIIPTSLEIMQFMFVWMFICNSAGHLPYEFYPKFLYDFPIIKQFNTATHHHMHHQYYNSNFSLYYNWWDRWMNTNQKSYFVRFQEVKAKTHLALKKPLNPSC